MQIAAILIIGLAASPLHPRPSPQSQARPPPSARPRRPPFSGMLIAESFTGRVRYSGASLGYHLASVIAGGPAPLIATWLYAEFQSAYAIAAYILVCAVITIISATLMTDYTGKDIEGEFE